MSDILRDIVFFFFFQAEDGIRDLTVTGVQTCALPIFVRDTRERLNMSQRVFARKLRVNPRTLERWEQGRSKPNDQAAALILLVRRFPDTVDRLDAISSSRRSRRAA